MQNQVRTALLQCSVTRDQTVLAGVSGGADSLALLHILNELKQQGCIRAVIAAHLNHGIRGREAEEDAEYTKMLCGQWNIPLYLERVDVKKIAAERGQTLEEAARHVRYAFLRRVKAECGAACIAVAHHRDDQAETILLHLLRGAGLNGLSGMRMHSGDIIRPLLCVTRKQIEDYLCEHNIPFCTDSTNLIADGTRNKVRLELLPLLKREYNPAIVDGLCRMADLIQKDEAYLVEQAKIELEQAALARGYSIQKLIALPPPIQTRALRLIAQRAGIEADVDQNCVMRMSALLRSGTGARTPLPNGLWAVVSYDALCVERPETCEPFCIALNIQGETKTPLGVFRAQFVDRYEKDTGGMNAYFDFHALPKALVVRQRRDGDRFHPLGASGGKKLKDYFIDKKIPRSERGVPLICSEESVLFVPGGTIADAVKVTQQTTCILRVTYMPNNTNQSYGG